MISKMFVKINWIQVSWKVYDISNYFFWLRFYIYNNNYYLQYKSVLCTAFKILFISSLDCLM